LGVFDGNHPLCNTQQSYSPPGEEITFTSFFFADDRPANPGARIFKGTADLKNVSNKQESRKTLTQRQTDARKVKVSIRFCACWR
jgi:hypothetical protein